MKFIFITGGVLSSLGKGIASASLGLLLKRKGLKVSIVKCDPYLNVDAGTMNPFQHGEVFVTEDGGETDLDIGHYERFLNENLSKENNITSGQVYLSVIEKERKGYYLGSTVQIIPHLTDEIKTRIRSFAFKSNLDILICEIGGTVGDIESLPFLEAIRQMRLEEGEENTFYIHVGMIVYLRNTNEFKTKPIQHSIQKLREIGIQPDAIILRTEKIPDYESIKKVALFSTIPLNRVFISPDLETVYELPLILNKQGIVDVILEKLRILKYEKIDLKDWENFVLKIKNPKNEVKIGIIGKYINVKDAYKSILEALIHAGAELNLRVNNTLIDSEENFNLDEFDGIIIPGGFGKRGIEGKLKAIEFCRNNNIPILGICLGMQLMIIEFGRNVLNLKNANSTEFDKNTPYPLITLLEGQENIKYMGGTLRLGSIPIKIKKNTLAYEIYNSEVIYERHRHRYEFNPEFRAIFENAGLIVSGENAESELAEIIELKGHRFFLGVQFHPEFKSKALNPSPIFLEFLKKSLK
ncbi:MAG: CTP synthase [candidate division WOR-3 bacterium]